MDSPEGNDGEQASSSVAQTASNATPRLLDVKDIVARHHALIARNIVPSDDLLEAIKHFGALGGAMIDDVKDSKDREEKVYKLLDLVALRGPSAMNAFCDALQHSGHAFIADFIRDEMKELKGKDKEALKLPYSTDFAEGKDIVKYLCGKFERALHEKEKADLSVYLEKKFQQALLKKMYKMNKEDKQKAIDAKQHQLEDTWRFTEILSERDKIVVELKDKLQEAITESASKGVQLGNMKKYVNEVNEKHEKQVAAQLKFNNANDSMLRRLTERTTSMEKTCAEMILMMEPFMPDPEAYKTRKLSFVSDSMDRLITEHDKCKWALKRVLMRIADLLEIEEKYLVLAQERDFILDYIGIPRKKQDGVSLKFIFKEFVVGKDTIVEQLTSEKKDLKDRLMAIHARATEAEEKIDTLHQRHINLSASTEEAYRKDLGKKDKEILMLKANRDELLDQHSVKDETIQQMEDKIVELQRALDSMIMDRQRSNRSNPQSQEKMQSDHSVKEIKLKEMKPFDLMPKAGASGGLSSKKGSLKSTASVDPEDLPPLKNAPNAPPKPRSEARKSILSKNNTKLLKNTKPGPIMQVTSMPSPEKLSKRTRMDQYHQGK